MEQMDFDSFMEDDKSEPKEGGESLKEKQAERRRQEEEYRREKERRARYERERAYRQEMFEHEQRMRDIEEDATRDYYEPDSDKENFRGRMRDRRDSGYYNNNQGYYNSSHGYYDNRGYYDASNSQRFSFDRFGNRVEYNNDGRRRFDEEHKNLAFKLGVIVLIILAVLLTGKGNTGYGAVAALICIMLFMSGMRGERRNK